MSTTHPADVARIARYVITHVEAGHDNPSDPKYGKYVKDLATLLVDVRRVLYRIAPPATAHEQLSYLIANTATHTDVEKLMSAIGDQIQAAADATGAAADAAANRVIALINSDRTAIADLQAKSDADDALIATLQAQIDAGTVTPEAAQAVVDSLEATNVKLGDLDSDPLTPV